LKISRCHAIRLLIKYLKHADILLNLKHAMYYYMQTCIHIILLYMQSVAVTGLFNFAIFTLKNFKLLVREKKSA